MFCYTVHKIHELAIHKIKTYYIGGTSQLDMSMASDDDTQISTITIKQKKKMTTITLPKNNYPKLAPMLLLPS